MSSAVGGGSVLLQLEASERVSTQQADALEKVYRILRSIAAREAGEQGATERQADELAA